MSQRRGQDRDGNVRRDPVRRDGIRDDELAGLDAALQGRHEAGGKSVGTVGALEVGEAQRDRGHDDGEHDGHGGNLVPNPAPNERGREERRAREGEGEREEMADAERLGERDEVGEAREEGRHECDEEDGNRAAHDVSRPALPPVEERERHGDERSDDREASGREKARIDAEAVSRDVEAIGVVEELLRTPPLPGVYEAVSFAIGSSQSRNAPAATPTAPIATAIRNGSREPLAARARAPRKPASGTSTKRAYVGCTTASTRAAAATASSASRAPRKPRRRRRAPGAPEREAGSTRRPGARAA